MVVKMETYLATKTDAIVAVSDSQRQELIEVYKIAPAEKVFTVPLGFNLDKFSTDQVNKRNIFRAKYGFSQSELVIGIIGRLVPIKNHEMFLEVAAIIKAQKEINAHVRFVIIGDGESRPALKIKAAELQLSCSYYITKPKEQTDIVITSWETAIDQALAGLDIIVLTSNNEGTPVSLIEAQAALKPVVTTNVGGVEDIVIHGQTGFITAVGDSVAFAGYVQQLIDDPALRNSLGKNGYDNVIKRYSKQRLINDMKTLYHSLLKKKNLLQ
jgi:glycosyltransferase involved in cell wall biosynthesis